MDEKESKFILENPDGKEPSEIGEAIDVLLPQYRPKNRAKGGYKKLSTEIGKERLKVSEHGSFTLSQIHRVYRLLPQGIRWKIDQWIDQRKISIAHGVQIARLESKEDQWVLALATDAKRLSVKQCEVIVKLVLKKHEAGEKGYSLREALNRVAGFPFKGIPSIIDMSSPEEWIAISKEAWNRKVDWENFCHRLIAQKQSVLSDIEKVAEQISCWRRDFPEYRNGEMEQKLQSLESIADELRQLAELRQPAAEEAIQKPEAKEREKEKSNDVRDSGENLSVSSKKVEAEKAANVQSDGDAPESPKPSGDGGSNPEAEEKGKPNITEDSEENPSVSSADAEKEANVQSDGDEPKSPRPSEDGKQLGLLNSRDDRTKGKGKRRKKSAKKSGSMKRR